MLVITRKVGASVYIYPRNDFEFSETGVTKPWPTNLKIVGPIKITILGSAGSNIKVGVEAHENLTVLREELVFSSPLNKHPELKRYDAYHVSDEIKLLILDIFTRTNDVISSTAFRDVESRRKLVERRDQLSGMLQFAEGSGANVAVTDFLKNNRSYVSQAIDAHDVDCGAKQVTK